MLLQSEGFVVGQASVIVVFVDISVKPLDAVKGMLDSDCHVESTAVAKFNKAFLSSELTKLMFLHP